LERAFYLLKHNILRLYNRLTLSPKIKFQL